MGMTFEDALSTLGIAEDTGLKAARRAYLKLIKTHKPDRDPEGFKRVRSAYEVVVEQLEFRQMWDATSRGPVDIQATPEPAPPPPRAPSNRPTSSQRPSPADLMWTASVLLEEGGDPQQVESYAMQALQITVDDIDADPPSPYMVIDLCLALYARRQLREARRLSRVVVHWLAQTGLEREVMGGWLAGCHAVLHAFEKLPLTLSPVPFSIIATGLRDEDFDIERSLQAFGQDQPYAVFEFCEACERRAPMILHLWGAPMADGYDASDIERRPPVTGPEAWFGAAFRVLLFILVWGLLRTSCG